MRKKIVKYRIYLIIGVILFSSCTKILDISPPATVTVESTPEKDLQNSLSSIYGGAFVTLANSTGGDQNTPGYKAFMLGVESMGSDIVLHLPTYSGTIYFYTFIATNNITSSFPRIAYTSLYSCINTCNSGITLYNKIESPNDAQKIAYAQLLTLRAMCHFDIVRTFQHTYQLGKNLPAGIIRDQVTNKENAIQGKGLSTTKEFYDFFLKDIEEAIQLFEKSQTNYTIARPNKGYIDKNIAYGIAARMYLTKGTYAGNGGDKSDMDKAAEYAYKAQEGYNLMKQDDFLGGFNEASNIEWMWAVPQSMDNSNLSGIYNFYDTGDDDGGRAWYKNILPDPYFKKLFDYGNGYDTLDVRFKLFKLTGRKAADGSNLNSMIMNKLIYPKMRYRKQEKTGDILFMRVAEMYLIEAEAKARGGNNSDPRDAQAIVNELRTSRGATNTGYTVDVDFIIEERRRELWGEGITGAFDANRTQRAFIRKKANYVDFPEYSNNSSAPNYLRKEAFHSAYTTFWDGSPIVANSPFYLFQMPEREMLNNPAIKDLGRLPRL